MIDDLKVEQLADLVAQWRRADWVGQSARAAALYKRIMAVARAGSAIERLVGMMVLNGGDLPPIPGEGEPDDA